MRTPNHGAVQLIIGDTTGIKTLDDLIRFVRDRDVQITASVQLLAAGHKDVTYVAPVKPRIGDERICDGTMWNPVGTGVPTQVWFNGTAWQRW